MNTRILIAAICVGLYGSFSGQTLAQSVDDPVPGTEGIMDMKSFWFAELRLAPNGGELFTKMPEKYQNCVVDHIVAALTPEAEAAINKFLDHKTYGNYAEMLQPLIDFVQLHQKEYGDKPGPIAGEACMKELLD